jgi:metallo-beta-lactamase family protein
VKIKFCGAAREVTGSCHLLTLESGFTILLDCGLYQGGGDDDGQAGAANGVEGFQSMHGFNERWLFDPSRIDCLIVSHAHIDHTGRIPKLVADGFRGTIYATHATRDLCNLMLLDSAKIQESDAERDNRHLPPGEPERHPLYTVQDVGKTMRMFAGFNYEQVFHVHPDVRVMFLDAGHILGSATVNLEIREGDRIIHFTFTGDIGRPSRPILSDPLPIPPADYVICESTYGDREHETAPNELERLVRIVRHTCMEKRGKLIIPAFSVGRTQEIVYLLDQLQHAGRLPRIPVFVDSPLATNATDVFLNHPECFDAELNQYLLEDDNPFGFNDLFYIRSAEGSKNLNNNRRPCIIISASGMMNAGRIRHHLLNNIEHQRNTFLIIGYCAPNTPGGQLRAGAKSMHIMGQFRQVLADIEIMDSFSAHGDRAEMLEVLQHQKGHCKKIWLTHGTLDRQEKWRDYLLENGMQAVDIPSLGEEVEI